MSNFKYASGVNLEETIPAIDKTGKKVEILRYSKPLDSAARPGTLFDWKHGRDIYPCSDRSSWAGEEPSRWNGGRPITPMVVNSRVHNT